MKKKKEEKESCCESSSYLSKNLFFAYECLRRSDLFERFFCINLKITLKTKIRNYYL
jgi:hypothetical protein